MYLLSFRAHSIDHSIIRQLIAFRALYVPQVTVMVDAGHELGISIRGGAEHGLGIYISAVEEGSVAEAYGIKVMTDK